MSVFFAYYNYTMYILTNNKVYIDVYICVFVYIWFIEEETPLR